MKAKFTAIIKPAEEGGLSETRGMIGQVEAFEEATRPLAQASEFLEEEQNLDALLAGITVENRHPEIETGKRLGREIW
jgi:hypothetical protein